MAYSPCIAVRILIAWALLSGGAPRPPSTQDEVTGVGLNGYLPINIFSENGRDPRILLSRASNEARRLLPNALAVTDENIVGFDGNARKLVSNAVLVSPCYALTEYHSIFGRKRDLTKSHNMQLWLGQGELRDGFRYMVTARPVRTNTEPSNGLNGLVLLQLAGCAGKRLGWIALSIPGRQRIKNRIVGAAAYHGDLPFTKIAYQPSCSIRTLDRLVGLLFHDCASVGGASSGMIFERVGADIRLIALHFGSNGPAFSTVIRKFSYGYANYAVPLDMLCENKEMLDIIVDDIEAFGGANPASSTGGEAGRSTKMRLARECSDVPITSKWQRL